MISKPFMILSYKGKQYKVCSSYPKLVIDFCKNAKESDQIKFDVLYSYGMQNVDHVFANVISHFKGKKIKMLIGKSPRTSNGTMKGFRASYTQVQFNNFK